VDFARALVRPNWRDTPRTSDTLPASKIISPIARRRLCLLVPPPAEESAIFLIDSRTGSSPSALECALLIDLYALDLAIRSLLVAERALSFHPPTGKT
jgi:hypothetical protein